MKNKIKNILDEIIMYTLMFIFLPFIAYMVLREVQRREKYGQ